MSLRLRIMLLVALTFAAIAAIGGYSILQSKKNASSVRSVTEGVVPSALASADLVARLKEVQLVTMTLATAPDKALAEEARDKLASQKAQLKAGLEQQFLQAGSSTQQGLLEQTRESLENYFTAIDEMTQFKLAGQNEMAQAMLFANVAQYKREMEQVIDTLRIEKNRSKDEAITVLNDNLTSAVSTITTVTLLAFAVLAASDILLYRQIVRPISTMQSLMSEIATSQDFTRRLPVERMDEIGQSTVAFNTMIARIQESSGQLRQKTADIQTMLQNIPQGILTVVEGNTVHPEYSDHLGAILETHDIAGRDVLDLVFSGTQLGADSLAQVEATIGACLGEDLMNFEFNQHLLVGEVEKHMADGRVKALDLNWSPITNADGMIERLLLCVRDVTELRRLAAEANEKKQELEIIGEILAVSQEKFHDFIAGALKFVDENELILHQHAEQDADAVAHLFRNMHTLKGNARTYGLRHLTHLVHEAEQTYDKLRAPMPELAWDQALLLQELDGVRKQVERYARINEVSLGRKGPGRRGNVERYLLVDKDQIQQTIHRLEKVNTGNLHELIAARDAVHKTLRLLGTEPLGKSLASVFASLPSLARELGKRPPVIRLEDHGYVIRNQMSGVLKNVFMHLLRNAIDHGLESKDERLALAKPKAGQISLEMNIAEGRLQIRLSDDGRGLALAKIRKTALQKGLIQPDVQLSDEEIASLIFRPGFSTADKVTEISGRGVGMDAVQDFIKRESGIIELRFLDQAVGANFRRFETVVSLPESCALHVEGRETLYVYDLRELGKEQAENEEKPAAEAAPGSPVQLHAV